MLKRLLLATSLFLTFSTSSMAAPISSLEFHDSLGFVAIDTLSFTTTGGATTTLTFSEPGAPAPGTQLDGTTFYDSFGVSFVDSVLFGPDAKLPDDGFGIANAPASTGVVNFFDDIASLTITWALSGGDPAGDAFFADAFDVTGDLLDSFAFTGSGTSESGTATLVMTAPVPEPATALLFGLGLGVLGWPIHRKSR